MLQKNVVLRQVSREDVTRIRGWLEDEEVSEMWFGRYSYGDPAHLGYHPDEMETATDAEWNRVFENPEHPVVEQALAQRQGVRVATPDQSVVRELLMHVHTLL